MKSCVFGSRKVKRARVVAQARNQLTDSSLRLLETAVTTSTRNYLRAVAERNGELLAEMGGKNLTRGGLAIYNRLTFGWEKSDMLLLLFYLGEVMYAIECKHVKEITPMVALKDVPHTPDFFAGFFNYRGAVVPVIDLGQLIHDIPCRLRLSTRIILVEYLKQDATPGIFGLIAERVTEAVKKSIQEIISLEVSMQEAPYLSKVLMDRDTMIHHIDVATLAKRLRVLHTDETGFNHASNDD